MQNNTRKDPGNYNLYTPMSQADKLGGKYYEVTKNDGTKEIKTPSQLSDSEVKAVKKSNGVVEGGRTSKRENGDYASISINKDTGEITVKLSDELTKADDFKEYFNEETLLNASKAYKLNKDYKVPFTEYKEDGTVEEKEITIPEYISKLNESMKNYAKNFYTANRIREKYAKEFGEEKAKKLTNSLTRLSVDYDGSVVPVPEFIKNSVYFKEIADKVSDDGYLKVDDLKEVYNLGDLGRDDITAIVGMLNAWLESGEWAEDEYYEDENGEMVYNRGNVREMAKALALRNYIYANDPDGKWYQKAGETLATFTTNASYQFARVFANILNLGEMAYNVLPFDDKNYWKTWIKEGDEAIQRSNEEMKLIEDATGLAATLGSIGGMIGGTVALGIITSGAGAALSSSSAAAASEAAQLARGGLIAADMLGYTTSTTLATLSAMEAVSNAANIFTGAVLLLNSMPGISKAMAAADIAKAFLESHKVAGTIVSFVIDTFHDALLYDSNSLREALESSDDDTRNFWLGQFASNGKWWGGFEGGKAVIKLAGKTKLGRMLNAVGSKYINKAKAGTQTKWRAIKDHVAGGSLEKKIQEKLEKALEDSKNRTAKRLQRKLETLEFNDILRDARRELGKIDLEFNGIFLSDASEKAFMEASTAVKAIEDAIDAYGRSIQFKRTEMLGQVYDPALKKYRYINPTLAASNNSTTKFYLKLAKEVHDSGLRTVKNSLLDQDTIDYLVGSYALRRYDAIAGSKSINSTKAANAAAIARQNLEDVAERLPDSIKKLIDNNIHIYTDFYSELNAYGLSKSLLDRDRLAGYENETWGKAGYMPVIVAADDAKLSHKVIDSDGKIAAVVEQEMKDITYSVRAGQHYVDPELTRQSRINRYAQAEINRQMLDSYTANTGAAFSEYVTGEQTAFARDMGKGRDILKKTVAIEAKGFATDNFKVVFTLKKNPEVISNRKLKLFEREKVVAGMSNQEIDLFLHEHNILSRTNKSVRVNLAEGVKGEKSFQKWYSELNSNAKRYVNARLSEFSETGKKADYLHYRNYRNVVMNYGDDFETGLRRAYVAGSDEFAKSTVAKEAAHNLKKGRDAFYGGYFGMEMKSKIRGIKGIDTDRFVDDMQETIVESINNYIERMAKDKAVEAAINACTKSGSTASTIVAEQFILKQLQENGKEAVYKNLEDGINKAKQGVGIFDDDKETLINETNKFFDHILQSRIDDANSAIKSSGEKAIDEKTLYEEVKLLNNRIAHAENEVDLSGGDSGMIMYIDGNGREAFATVDPAFASLYNRRYNIDAGEASALAKFNAAASTVFRWGTTSFNLSSWGNQMFRDFGNAIYVGGAWKTIKTYAEDMRSVWGDNVVEQIKNFDPDGYEMRQLKILAQESGQTLDAAAISRELMRGSAISPSSTERGLYKELWKSMKNDSNIKLDEMEASWKKTLKKLNPDDMVNGKRETYLRNRVYAANLSDALDKGYSLKQARVYAEFAMNNATTNFSRAVYHMQSIAESTPYFRAAINGTASFWRMWSLDPVGISGRIVGGLILPAMALTGYSLSTEENKEVYKNIPEYSKEDNLVFVVNGEPMSIPIPQELSVVIAPFRQFVEHLYDADRNTFWELLSNDLLGISPIDLQGFSSIDMNRMTKDPTIVDRISRGFSRVFSQVAPVPLKTIYMLATSTDPYTGKNLNDPSYWYWDDENGTVELMDYSENALAKILGQEGLLDGTALARLGDQGFLNRNSKVWEKVLSGVFGNTGADILDDIVAAFTETKDGMVGTIAENIIDRATSPITIEKYNLIDSQWRQAISALTAEKNAILNSKRVKAINSELSMEKDPEKRKKLLAERANYIGDYTQRVADTVKRLSSEYEGTFDRSKLAAAIQLLNFNSDASWQAGSQASSDYSSGSFYGGKDYAISVLSQAGISGTEDLSVFGYLTTDKDGNAIVKYNEPLAVMDLANTQMSESNYHLANIKSIVSANSLYDKHEAVSEQINKIYDKGNLTNADRAAIEAIQINWNAEVAKVLAEYVDKFSAEAAINNKAVRDYLYTYIEVPSSWEVNNKGRGVSLGDRGSKKAAYYDSWVKSMFSVNDPYKGQY